MNKGELRDIIVGAKLASSPGSLPLCVLSLASVLFFCMRAQFNALRKDENEIARQACIIACITCLTFDLAPVMLDKSVHFIM